MNSTSEQWSILLSVVSVKVRDIDLVKLIEKRAAILYYLLQWRRFGLWALIKNSGLTDHFFDCRLQRRTDKAHAVPKAIPTDQLVAIGTVARDCFWPV
jgi:hypothetical protein